MAEFTIRTREFQISYAGTDARVSDVDSYFFPLCSGNNAPCDLKLLIEPFGIKSWLAAFERDHMGENGVFVIPDSKKFLVAVSGATWLINSAAPADFEKISQSLPTLTVFPVAGKKLLLVYDCISMQCVSDDGLQWVSERLVSDDLLIKDVLGDHILCLGTWMGELRDFTVALSTGRILEESFPDWTV